MKVLMALLDEEALTPPCPNKADLLSEDQPALSGAEGTCVLTLFRLVPVNPAGLVSMDHFCCVYFNQSSDLKWQTSSIPSFFI